MKMHLSLPTDSLDASVAFYQTLLGAAPFKRRADYALFITEKPALELALPLAARVRVASDEHYGIAVDEVDAVDAAHARLDAAGLPTAVERSQTCCYARQTKVWTSDPHGRRWEIYHVEAESDERGEAAACCDESTCDDFAECCGAYYGQ